MFYFLTYLYTLRYYEQVSEANKQIFTENTAEIR